MSKAVFIQNPESIYADRPGQAYNFPSMYLGTVRETIGDWVVFYEGRKGAFGYVAIQKVDSIVPDPSREDWYFALMDPGSLWQFETVVGRLDASGLTFEAMLRGEDGRPFRGGANTLAVRRLKEAEFARIVEEGLRPALDAEAIPRTDAIEQSGATGMAEARSPFDAAPLAGVRDEILVSRKVRDASFARMVKRAYKGCCAMSGLELRNGGGRAEVEAAHVRAVEHGGPDVVSNGLALTGTLHWMFDRGLVSISDDWTILISHNKVPDDTAARLIVPDRKLRRPENHRDWPHPDYLRWHRETIFGQVA